MPFPPRGHVVLVAVADISTDTPYQQLPPLNRHERAAVRDGMREHGVLEPIHVDERLTILSGHHRVDIARELWLQAVPALFELGLSERQKRDRALVIELARRHLDQKQRRDLIGAKLREEPDRSSRDIARLIGVSHVTVEHVRKQLEGSGDIPEASERVAPDAKSYRTPPRPAGGQSDHPARSARGGGSDRPPDRRPPTVRVDEAHAAFELIFGAWDTSSARADPERLSAVSGIQARARIRERALRIATWANRVAEALG